MNDLAAAITQSFSSDGQTPMTGNANFAGFQLKNLGDATTLDAAVSLGYVQDGKHYRLTNVSGTNVLTASLPGGATAFVAGQVIQIQPSITNTGPMTVAINGGAPIALLSPVGGPLAATNLQAGKSYIFQYRPGAGWVMVSSPDQMSFAQSAISGWDRPAGGTYPDVAKVNANTVSIPAGSGRIIAPSTRDQSGAIEVSWVAQSVALTNIPNAWATTLGVDVHGNIVQLVGNLQAQWARQYILLATVAHIDGQIDGVVNQPSVFGDAAYQAFDLGVLFHNTITAGGQVVPSANTLHMDVKAGRMWLVGGNADNPDQPNFVDFADQLNITLYPSTATNVVAAATNAVPVTQYDPAGAGVVTNIPVPLSQAVIHRLFLMAGQYVLCYGQTLYPDLNTAIQSINNDNATFKPPAKLIGATLFAYVCATANCTNLNDGVGGRIVGANAVSAAGSGGGGGVSEAPLDGNAYARLNGAWWRSIFLDPNYNGMLGNNAKADGISLSLNAQAGTNRQLNFQSSGVNRWALVVANTAEPGSNVGANIALNRYADNGAYLDTPFAIARNTGMVTLGNVSILGTTSCGGAVSINMAAGGSALNITNTNTNGAMIVMRGDGATTPSKMIRARAGNLEFVNDANSVIIATLADSGALNIGGTLTAPNVTASGNVSAGQLITGSNVVSSGVNLVMGPTGAGTVYLRPNGVGNAAGQTFVGSNGAISVNSATGAGGGQASIMLQDGNPSVGLIGGGGSYPNKYLRAQNSSFQVVNGGYTYVMASVNDFGSSMNLTVSNTIQPSADNAGVCGTSGARWQTVYAVSGTINTCDVREKNITGPNPLGLDFVNAIPVSCFKYKVGHNDTAPLVDADGAAILDANGNFQTVVTPVPGIRTHVTGMAQDIQAQLIAAGLDPSNMAMWSLDDPANPDSRQGLRPDQLMWVLWTAVQQLSAQVKELKAKLGL
jgi:hypothetical protein